MAINIKELFNADADNIKVDKINYNFDQLILSGGGPSGIKGDTGLTGNTGLKGEKGDIGPKGEEGTKGEQGSSANLWDRDTILSASGDVDVYRPYDNVSGLRSRIVLGESTALNSLTPPSDTDSLLNLSLPPATNNDVSSQIIFNNDEPGDPKDFKMSTFYEAGVGTRFTFAGEAATAGERTSLLIDIPDSVTITSDGRVNVGNVSNTNIVSIMADTLIELNTNDDINIYAGSQIEVEAPEITIQGPGGSGGTIDISSFTNTINAPQSGGTNTMSAESKNTITSVNLNEILSDGGKNLIRANNATNEISAEINSIEADGTSNINILKNSGVNKFTTEDSVNTSTQNILFNQDGVNVDAVDGNTGPERGEGIQFPRGGAQSEGFGGVGLTVGLYEAPNRSSTEGERTLNDYFHKSDWTDWSIGAINTAYPGYGPVYSRGLLDAEPVGTTITNFSPTNITFKEGSYVKIGDFIEGYGTITAVAPATGWDDDLDSSLEGRSLFIDLTNHTTASPLKYTFPFLNGSLSPVHCSDIVFTINSNNSVLGEYPHIKGIIYPNSNRIYLYRMLYQGDKIFIRALSPMDISGDTGTTFRLSFKFSMIANNQQSYSRKYLYNDQYAGVVGFGFSDRNLKTNIVKVGESPSGYNIYEFNFIDNLPEYVIKDLGGDPKGFVFQGVIADELPSELVARFPNEDFDRVKYSEIDVEFKKVR